MSRKKVVFRDPRPMFHIKFKDNISMYEMERYKRNFTENKNGVAFITDGGDNCEIKMISPNKRGKKSRYNGY